MESRIDLVLAFIGDLEDSLLFAWDELRQCRAELKRLSRLDVDHLSDEASPRLGSVVDSCLVELPHTVGVPEYEGVFLCSDQVGNLVRHVRSEIWSHMEMIEGGLNHAKILSLMLDMDMENEENPRSSGRFSLTESTCDTLTRPVGEAGSVESEI